MTESARTRWSAVVSFWKAAGSKRWALLFWGSVTVVAITVLVAVVTGIVVDEVALDRRHTRVDAIVIATSWSRTGGIADVRFRSAGRRP
jgi:uncharacterized membrane protein